MKTFPFFSAFYHSFSSKELYRDVAANWRGKAFVYLLILLAVTWVPEMLDMHRSLRLFVANEGSAAFSQVPAITIEDGILSIDAPEPYYIRFGDDDEILAIIDTTDGVTSLDDEEGRVLVTESRVFFVRGDTGYIESFSLSDVGDMSFDAQTLEEGASAVAPFIPIVAYPFALVWSFAYRLAQVLVYSLFAMLIVRQHKLTLDFASVYSMTLVAITPAVLLKTVVWLSDFSMPLLFVPHVALALGYVYFGVVANRLEDERDFGNFGTDA
jgi:hypothetical protein